MILSEKALSIWAKSSRKDGTVWHPLIAHMLDVSACAEAILELEPESTRQLYQKDWGFTSWQSTCAWLAATIGLHDLGKCSPSFVNLWALGADRVESTGLIVAGIRERRILGRGSKKYEGVAYVHHGYISQHALATLFQGKGWSFDFAEKIADAVGAHHGLRATPRDIRYVENSRFVGDHTWEEVREELFEAVLTVVGCDKPSLQDDLSAEGFIRLSGLTSFADWIASNESFFSFHSEPGDLVQYYQERLARARKILPKMGWHPRSPLQEEQKPFSQWFEFPPRPLQQVMIEFTQQASQPMLLVVEAPMGEGKTEAAFDGHLRLQHQLGHRGMYVALPTQATGNAMFKRTLEFLKRMSHQHGLDLQLAHGATLLNQDFQNILQSGIYEGEDLETQHVAQVQAASWFTHRKRALLSAYGVGTVDQALLGVLNTRHFFVRLWGLGNRTVVLDEVHAYDAYTSQLIFILIEWLHAMGSSVILMSATLPPQLRKALLRAYGGGSTMSLPEAPYPRITQMQGGQVQVRSFEASRQQKLCIKPLSTEPEALAQHLIQLVKNGGCAACLVNTVTRAQAVFQQLKSLEAELNLGVDLELFHARFPASDRSQREARVLRKFGKPNKEGENPERPLKSIVVATQVIEQSLDLDFDVMVSDLAPIDLLLQRAGRMHRHAISQRWDYQGKSPTLYIAGLSFEENLPQWGAPLFWNAIYDENVLQQTFLYLRESLLNAENFAFQLPEDIDKAVKDVYENRLEIPEWIRNADAVYGDSLGKQKAMRSQAEDVSIQHPFNASWVNPPAREKFDPEDDPLVAEAFMAKTRLGDALTFIPIEQNEAGYWVGEYALNLEVDLTTDMAKNFYLQHIKVSKKSVLTHYRQVKGLTDAEEQIRSYWQASPLLRHCFPLILHGGTLQIGKVKMLLSQELGLVIHD